MQNPLPVSSIPVVKAVPVLQFKHHDSIIILYDMLENRLPCACSDCKENLKRWIPFTLYDGTLLVLSKYFFPPLKNVDPSLVENYDEHLVHHSKKGHCFQHQIKSIVSTSSLLSDRYGSDHIQILSDKKQLDLLTPIDQSNFRKYLQVIPKIPMTQDKYDFYNFNIFLRYEDASSLKAILHSNCFTFPSFSQFRLNLLWTLRLKITGCDDVQLHFVKTILELMRNPNFKLDAMMMLFKELKEVQTQDMLEELLFRINTIWFQFVISNEDFRMATFQEMIKSDSVKVLYSAPVDQDDLCFCIDLNRLSGRFMREHISKIETAPQLMEFMRSNPNIGIETCLNLKQLRDFYEFGCCLRTNMDQFNSQLNFFVLTDKIRRRFIEGQRKQISAIFQSKFLDKNEYFFALPNVEIASGAMFSITEEQLKEEFKDCYPYIPDQVLDFQLENCVGIVIRNPDNLCIEFLVGGIHVSVRF
jgi:hypothetical protein